MAYSLSNDSCNTSINFGMFTVGILIKGRGKKIPKKSESVWRIPRLPNTPPLTPRTGGVFANCLKFKTLS